MKTKKVISIILTIILILGILGTAKVDVNAEGTLSGSIGMFAYIPVSADLHLNINATGAKGHEYMLFPSSVSFSSVYFHYSAEGKNVTMYKDGKEAPLPSDSPVNISKYLSADTGDGSQILTVHVTDAAGAVASYDLYVMKSANIASMYILSGDPAKGRAFVEEKKSNRASGSLVMLNSNGSLVYAGGLSQIKGRGNTSWGAAKKPYGIKLATATDLIQTGNKANAHKNWVLLANAYDATLIHNTVGYKLAQNMGLNAPDCRPVDLYYDGVYRGNYLLTEKIEVESGRVDISNLEKKNDKANEGKNLSQNATAQGQNKYGCTIQYVTGVNNPENISGGYLIEQDNAFYASERSYFISSSGTPFVVKSPENCSKEEMEYISCFVEEMIQAAANGGVHPTNGKSVWEYIDKQSLVRTVVHQEIIKNADAFASSTFYYMDKGSGMLIAGPIWDLDDSYGVREDVAPVDGFVCDRCYIDYFVNLPDFRSAVKSYYNSTGYSKATNVNIDKYAKEIAASQKMNRLIWNDMVSIFQKLGSYQEDLNYMKSFAKGRAAWLKGVYATW